MKGLLEPLTPEDDLRAVIVFLAIVSDCPSDIDFQLLNAQSMDHSDCVLTISFAQI